MSGKIEISRDLLERIESGMWYADSRKSLADEIEKILAAPVVERQEPVARIDGMYGDPEAFAEREIRPLCDVNKLKIGTLLYTSPPAPVAVVLPERKPIEHGKWRPV